MKKEKAVKKLSVKNNISSKEAMVAAIAHEIKNPLNAIKGASQYMYDKYGEQPEIKEFSGIIIEESNRLESYLNEFLSFARGVKPDFKHQNLYNFITGVIMTIKHTLPFVISVQPDHDPEIMVDIDAEQLRQVLVNLFNNARDAVKGKTQQNVSVSMSQKGRHVYIAVRDNGCGIAKASLGKVFEAFYTTKKEGLGIGLAISRTIVRKHGGDITVKSGRDKWTQFTIKLPKGRGPK